MCENPVPSGTAEDYSGSHVGILGRGGADRKCRQARRTVLLRQPGGGQECGDAQW